MLTELKLLNEDNFKVYTWISWEWLQKQSSVKYFTHTPNFYVVVA